MALHEDGSERMTDSAPLNGLVAEIIEAHYDFGQVLMVAEIPGGYTNLNYSVITRKNNEIQKHFVRRYRRCASLACLEFEHLLLDHISSRVSGVVAGLIHTREEKGFVRRLIRLGGEEVESFFAAFDFIEGEDKYTWTRNRLNDAEYASSARVLALLHSATFDFRPVDIRCAREKLTETLPRLAGLFEGCAALAAGSVFDNRFRENLSAILEAVHASVKFRDDLAGLPVTGIHGDFHPGNMKFADNRVTGVFDFDWANIDLRLFDVALALIYFCFSWEGFDDGRILPEKALLFLREYQNQAVALSSIGPMTKLEIELLPEMLAASNQILLKWTTADTYYAQRWACDEEEYLVYLQHHLRILQCLESGRREIVRLLEAI